MDEELIPIDIPLDKGLNGYRVAFIRANDQDRVNQVTDIDGLRQLRLGQASSGTMWCARSLGVSGIPIRLK
jgi:hypothetical protein